MCHWNLGAIKVLRKEIPGESGDRADRAPEEGFELGSQRSWQIPFLKVHEMAGGVWGDYPEGIIDSGLWVYSRASKKY